MEKVMIEIEDGIWIIRMVPSLKWIAILNSENSVQDFLEENRYEYNGKCYEKK